jgi:hypothetical protein
MKITSLLCLLHDLYFTTVHRVGPRQRHRVHPRQVRQRKDEDREAERHLGRLLESSRRRGLRRPLCGRLVFL